MGGLGSRNRKGLYVESMKLFIYTRRDKTCMHVFRHVQHEVHVKVRQEKKKIIYYLTMQSCSPLQHCFELKGNKKAVAVQRRKVQASILLCDNACTRFTD